MLLLLCSAPQVSIFSEPENPFQPQRPFMTAKISYESSMGPSVRQEEILFIKGNSQASLIVTKADFNGQKQASKQLVVSTPEYIYEVDFTSNTASKMPNPNGLMYEKYQKLSPMQQRNFKRNLEQYQDRMLFGFAPGMQINQLGTETVLDRECVVYEVMGEKIWIWKEAQIPLKHIGQIEKVVTEIMENIMIEDSQFELPAQIKVTTHPAAASMEQMAEQMFQAIKEGQASATPEPPAVEPEPRQQKLTKEKEEQLREEFRQQGMHPQLIDQMIRMMQKGMH